MSKLSSVSQFDGCEMCEIDTTSQSSQINVLSDCVPDKPSVTMNNDLWNKYDIYDNANSKQKKMNSTNSNIIDIQLLMESELKQSENNNEREQIMCMLR